MCRPEPGCLPRCRACAERQTVQVHDDDELTSDRHAIEAITGRSFDGVPWPEGALQPGTRVRVVKDAAWDGPWRSEFVGAIDSTIVPMLVPSAAARPGELEYSVAFDSPQFDADGDGPYRKAVIWDRYLRRL
jgi:hypothetical protein